MAGTCGALVVFGSGPGIGRNVAAVFAERGFKNIFFLSRNKTRLPQDADFVRAASAGARVDVINEKTLGDVPLECVLLNHARLEPSTFFDFTVEELDIDLKVSVISLYAVAKWAMLKLLRTARSTDAKTPSFIVTSGMSAKDPFPAMFSLAACKAGQYNLVHSMHKEYKSKGVHCALVVVGGTVTLSYPGSQWDPENLYGESSDQLRQDLHFTLGSYAGIHGSEVARALI